MASSAARNTTGTAYYSNPTQAFAQTSRQFLSSRAGEKSSSYDVDEEDPRRQRRGAGYVSPPPALSPKGSYVLPPLVQQPNGYPASPNTYAMSRREIAAQMGRSSTAAIPSHSPSDRQKGSLYPHHLLTTSNKPRADSFSQVAPYSSYDSSASRERAKYSSPTPSYGSPLHSPPSSTASPPPNHPNSPPYSSQVLPNRHQAPHPHRSHSHSYSTNYATDVAPSNNKLLPQRSSKRNSTGANGVQYAGTGAVGPALAGGIYPVLPKPPSVVGSAQPTSIARKMFQKQRPIIDEDEEASNALNTYR